MLTFLLSNLFAQEPSVSTLEQAPVVLERVEPEYPEVIEEQGIQGDVLLEIELDDKGNVLAANVLESLHPEVDKAAIDAVLQFRFTPYVDAKGIAQPSTLQYRISFSVKKSVQDSIQGSIQSIDGVPLEGVILLFSKGEELRSIESDGEGRFSLADIPSGNWDVLAQKDGFDTLQKSISVVEGQVTVLDLILAPLQIQEEEPSADFEIVIEERAINSELTERFISSEEIFFLPGSNGDVVKAVQNLPGIARAPLGVGQLIIRGTAPEDSTYYIDGGNIPDVFHFGGLTTVVSNEIIEEVAFLPGNYSVRYGRQLGGLVDIRTRPSLPEKTEGVVSVDIYQSAFYLVQPIGEKWAISASGRRSYADFILNPILNSTDLTIRAPRYYDAQLRLSFAPNDDEYLDLMYFMSDDIFQFLGQDVEGNEQNALLYSKNFHKLRFRWTKDLEGGIKRETTIVAGPERQDFDQGATGDSFEERWGVNLRHEWNRSLSEENNVGFRLGMDIYTGVDSFLYDIPSFPYPKEEGEFFFLSPAFYGEFTVREGNTTLSAGLRSEGYTLGTTICVPAYDPRVTVRQQIGELVIKGGAGLFSQFPEPRELDPDADGNQYLVSEGSWQYSTGVEYPITEELKLDASVFYNTLDRLVVGRGDRFEFFTGPPLIGPKDTESYANLGTGTIYGFESQLRYDGDGFLALLATTISRSERVDRNGDTRLFAYDQPFLVNALFSKTLPKEWRLGGRVRYGSGNPYTPVQNSVYDLNRREFIPVYADYDSGRLPAFFSLDVRIDKTYVFTNWNLTAYLDIQNLTNNANLELMAWSYDYENEEPITGNPLFPAFGFKGDF